PDRNAPPAVFRWLTGNSDPAGRLPWPFGATSYLVWWGSGSLPLWVASIPALAYLMVSKRTTGERRLVAGWTGAAWAQVTLPGLYWQHYYLLPTAGTAIAVAVCLGDAATGAGRAFRSRGSGPASGSAAWFILHPSSFILLVLGALIAATIWIQA